jgi:hypothetical protein
MSTPLVYKMMAENKVSILVKGCHGLIQQGRLTQFIPISKFTGLRTSYYITAIEHGQYNIFKWLYNNKCNIDTSAVILLARRGLIKYLDFMHKSGFMFREMFNRSALNLIDVALVHNQSLVAMFLHKINAAEISKDTARYAIMTKDTDVLAYFIYHGVELSEELYHTPIQHGLVRIVDFLLDIGCPYNDKTVALAESVNDINPNDDTRGVLLLFAGSCFGCAINDHPHLCDDIKNITELESEAVSN